MRPDPEGEPPVQEIQTEALEPALARFAGRPAHLHLETTAGAYTAGGFGAFARNLRVDVRQAVVRGRDGRFRAGIQTAEGWIYAEGLTHWELDAEGRLLLAGYDPEGRVTVVCTLSPRALQTVSPPRRLSPAARPPAAQPVPPPTQERALLVVLAHPDDETFGSGGTVALYAQAGVPITVAIATRGEMGRNMGKPFFATRETLHALRERELEAACAALGVGDLRLLGCWDKTTEFMDEQLLAAQVQGLLREVRPTLLLTFHPEFGGHPDHCAIGAATLAAVRRLPAAERPRVDCLVHPRHAGEHNLPLCPVDIRPVRQIKEEAVRAHRSQSEGMLDRAATRPEEAELRRRFLETEYYTPVTP